MCRYIYIYAHIYIYACVCVYLCCLLVRPVGRWLPRVLCPPPAVSV